jgi:hypothetical protein
MVLEISFKPKVVERYFVRSGNNFGNYTKEFSTLKQTQAEIEAEKKAQEEAIPYGAFLLSKLFLLSQAVAPPVPTPQQATYLNTLPPNYLYTVMPVMPPIPKEETTRYVGGTSKPLIYYKNDNKKLTFF